MTRHSLAKPLGAAAVLLWLAGCTTPGPYLDAPVVDHSAVQRPPAPPPPPVEVQPLPRQPPIVPQVPQTAGPVVPLEPVVPYEPPPGTVAPAPPPAAPEPAPVEIAPEGNQAVAALLDSAANYVGAGELDKAAAALERALRIEPRNGGIWHDLAQIRLHQRQYQEAESMATKSNSLTENRSLRARNWRLIGVARRALGNDAGADEAEAQAVVLGGS